MDPLYGVQLDSAFSSAFSSTADPTSQAQLGNASWPLPPADGAGQQHETGLSHEDLAWLEQQLSLAAGSPPFDAAAVSPPPPQGPHAFPPVSNARFHPYQLPPERAQRLRPPGANAALPPYLQSPQRPPLGPSTSSTGTFDWPSFGAVAPSFAPVPPPPTLSQPPARHAVLYPPIDSPSPLLLPDEPTPTYPPAPHASPASVFSTATTASTVAPSTQKRRRRARSAPPLDTPPASSSASPSALSSALPQPGGGLPTPQARREKRTEQLSSLFGWLDAQRWSFAHLFTALSDLDPGGARAGRVEAEHRRRLDEFLQLDEGGTGGDEGARQLREAKRRWALKKGVADEEKGPDEVVRLWEDLGGLGRRREGNMANAVKELHSNVHDGAVAGVAIRRIINRYGEAYNEAERDMKRLDAALSLPPNPHVTSAPREASVWTGVLVVPTTQADVLLGWLMAPGRPSLEGERGRIEPDHMRVYSSLSPLDLHSRGAELCRVILLRDAASMQQHGHNYDRLHSFTRGPVLAPLDLCGFAQYDDYSLFHHGVMMYLQLCVRYPQFREGKEATVTIVPDVPPPVHPTPLETQLLDRALLAHWDDLRLFLLHEHGGLLRSAVRAFAGVKLSKMDLLSVCDDTKAVKDGLKKNKSNPNDRILPYDPSISQIRNAWRNTAFWDPTAELVVWSAATTHFLELSALYPDAGRGVGELPGLESLLGGSQPASGMQTRRS
ncbi:hypothetical protein JCM10207_005206 [Rhodosporidiobolus poonsookiae]